MATLPMLREVTSVSGFVDVIERVKRLAETGGVGRWFVETIRDDGLYTGKCPNSHDLLIATQTLRHEMLFEIALNAIVDGYLREAVLSEHLLY